MLPHSDIETYGGKGAILNHIKENCPDLPIPPYSYNKKDFKYLKKPVIVRSSSPYEYGDFEGIFDSVPDVDTKQELRYAVRRIKESATVELASKYAKQNGFKIGRKMKMIFQEQSPSLFKGVMTRLPNNPDVFFINYSKYKDDWRFFYSESEGEIIDEMGDLWSQGGDLEKAHLLVDSYKQIESLKDIAEGYSLYVEFGLEPFAIFQARPFKRIETANFDLPSVSGVNYERTDLCMGLTGPDGIELPLVRCPSSTKAIGILNRLRVGEGIDFDFSELEVSLRNDLREVLKQHPKLYVFKNIPDVITRKEMRTPLSNHLHNSDNKFKEGYCLMMDSAIREEYPVDLRVPHMHTFVHGDSYNFLTHGITRLLKKADVSLLTSALTPELFENTGTGDKVRVISNGREAIVFPD